MGTGGQALADQEATRNSTPGCGGQSTVKHSMTHAAPAGFERPDPHKVAEDNRDERQRQRGILGGDRRFTVKCPRSLSLATLMKAVDVLHGMSVGHELRFNFPGTANGLSSGQDCIVTTFVVTTAKGWDELNELSDKLNPLGFTLAEW